jgi:hypothetical protein
MKKLLLSIVLVVAVANVFGATYYWVGGANGNWASTSCWSDISGGISGSSVPGASDNVIFDNSGKNVNPVVTSVANITVASITFINSDVTFAGPCSQTTISKGIVSGSNTVILSAENPSIMVGQNITLIGSNGGSLAQNSVVEAISGATLTLSTPATGSSTSTGTLLFGSYKITTNAMTIDGSKVSFADYVTVNKSLTFKGNSARIILNHITGGRNFTLGNGGDFVLSGNSATNYFTGNKNSYIAFNTNLAGPALTVFFDPANITFSGLSIVKGEVTIGNNVNTNRLIGGKNSTNPTRLILSSNVSLGIKAAGTSQFNATDNSGLIDASASGSKIVISGNHPSIFTSTARIFKEISIINELEINAPNNTFTPAFPIIVNKLTLTDGTLNNSKPNIITLNKGGSVNQTGGKLTTPIN